VTPDYKNHDFLRQKYVEERLSIKQISRLTASSKDSVRKGLRAAGIAIRQHGLHHGHPAQPRFGKRIQKGRETDFKAEQKVVGVIQEFRDQKMTLRQISHALTKLGVQTKCRGRSWHPEMVRRVLVRADATLATILSAPPDVLPLKEDATRLVGTQAEAKLLRPPSLPFYSLLESGGEKPVSALNP
jgi:hypothetical protein